MCTGTLPCNPSYKTGLPNRKACRAAFRDGNLKRTATLVEICGNVFSDAVSITAISTIYEKGIRKGAFSYIFLGYRAVIETARPSFAKQKGQKIAKICEAIDCLYGMCYTSIVSDINGAFIFSETFWFIIRFFSKQIKR